MTSATVAPVLDPCAEARRLRADGETLQVIADRLGVNASTVHRWTQDVQVAVRRRCRVCREHFTAARSTRRTVCAPCVEAQAARVAAAKAEAAERRAVRETERQARQAAAVERREAKRNALICDECGVNLLTPAPRCNFCEPDFDLEAALAALDNEGRPAVTGRSTTHGGKP